MNINYVTGDATRPNGNSKRKIIVHVCNNVGAWGAGFVLAISKRWAQPERKYRAWATGKEFMSGTPMALGQVQFVEVEPTITVANLIGQDNIGTENGPPVRYNAIRSGLALVAEYATRRGGSVHMPRIGCGLAGGEWSEVEPIIISELIERGVQVTVYDLPKK